MKREEYLKLIHDEIDGELDTNEQERLQNLLDQDKVAYNIHDLMHRTVALVSHMQQFDPPSDLTDRIMKSVGKPGRTAERPEYFKALISFLAPRRSWAFAFAAVVVIFTFLVSVLDRGESPVESDVTGTMGTGDQVSRTFSMTDGDLKAQFGLTAADGAYALSGQIAYAGGYRIRIRFHPEGSVSLIKNNTEQNSFTVRKEDNSYILDGRADRRFDLLFQAAGAPASTMDVTIEAEGRAQLTRKISLK
jgi:hypothetical protein